MNHHLKFVIDKLSPESRTVLDVAVSHAAAQRHTDITPEHLLLAIIRQESVTIESLGLKAGLPVNSLLNKLRHSLEQLEMGHSPTPVFAPALIQWLVDGWLLASTRWQQQQISPAALLAWLI